jgi:REP element-mobilizing transposase RayT
MSLPREVLPGRTYMITRRCSERRFLLRPDHETNNAFIYCLVVAAQRFGIQVIFTYAAANHHHTGIFDPDGRYPDFMAYFHKYVAKCQNALRGRFENFWSSEHASVVRLVEPNDILEKMIYALTNPVKDPLVERVWEWPGVNSYSATVDGVTLTATRPAHFFREDGSMPEVATLTISRPQGFEKMSEGDFAALIKMRVTAEEKSAAANRREQGIRVLGRERILNQDWRARPKSAEPHFNLSPRVAAKNKWARIEALARNTAFLATYLDARDRFAKGARDVVFPAGTWGLRRYVNVRRSEATAATAPE